MRAFAPGCALRRAPAPRPRGFAGPLSQQTQEGDLGEGPDMIRVRHRKARYYAATAAATVIGAGVAVGTTVTGANAAPHTAASVTSLAANPVFPPATTTPIKHLVVIFQENVSFDHYFGTYPHAANTNGQPFTVLPGTPRVNGLLSAAPGGGTLLTNNPNGANPLRYDPTNVNDLLTCDQNHNYTSEQQAFNGGNTAQYNPPARTA